MLHIDILLLFEVHICHVITKTTFDADFNQFTELLKEYATKYIKMCDEPDKIYRTYYNQSNITNTKLYKLLLNMAHIISRRKGITKREELISYLGTQCVMNRGQLKCHITLTSTQANRKNSNITTKTNRSIAVSHEWLRSRPYQINHIATVLELKGYEYQDAIILVTGPAIFLLTFVNSLVIY